jgi:LPXTG-motif cell wall-anchored protein
MFNTLFETGKQIALWYLMIGGPIFTITLIFVLIRKRKQAKAIENPAVTEEVIK